jgi:mannose/fructose-specific phosphotransferase system component IIA
MVKIALVSHGALAQSLLDTASKIVSFDKRYIRVFSVSGQADLDNMTLEIKNMVGEGSLILVDTFGGTSCNISVAAAHSLKNVFVLCGVNLNMLLSAINNMDKMDAKRLAKKVLEDGQKSLIDVDEKLK